MKVVSLLWLAILWVCSLDVSGTTTIKGVLKNHAGKKMHFFVHTDEFSMKRELKHIVQLSDVGGFEANFEFNEVTLIFLVIGNIEGMWFAHPNQSYTLTSFPTPSQKDFQTLSRALVSLNFQNLGKEDANALIPQFNQDFEVFMDQHFYDFALERYKGSEVYKTKLGVQTKPIQQSDSTRKETTSFTNWVGAFQDSVNLKYGEFFDNLYFETHVRYSIAELELMAGISRKVLYEDYLMSQPVRYTHPAYARFFLAFYAESLGLISQRNTNALVKAINADNDPYLVLELFKKDSLVLSDEVGQMAVIVGLRDGIGDKRFSQGAIKNCLKKLSQTVDKNKYSLVAAGLLYELQKGQSGEVVAPFTAVDLKLDKWESIDELNGYTYIFFFADWCTSCKKELQLMSRLRELYGSDIQFLVISLDENIQALKSHVQANKDQKFEFIFTGNTPEIREVFHLRAIPQAVMLNPDGEIMFDYTRKPSEGIQMEFDKIVQLLHPKNGGKTWQSK